MPPYPVPEIEDSELKAARQFLTAVREEERRARVLHLPRGENEGVTVRNGITRARHRSAAKSGV